MSNKNGAINDSTIARIAGNLLSGFAVGFESNDVDAKWVARSVRLARAIAAEVERTSTRTVQS